jgi:hypothetical protein
MTEAAEPAEAGPPQVGADRFDPSNRRCLSGPVLRTFLALRTFGAGPHRYELIASAHASRRLSLCSDSARPVPHR